MTSTTSTTAQNPSDAVSADPPGTVSEVFRAFLKLGLTSFGGPVAHLGYFRDELITRRRWLDERGYADLVALCQFLPGPASSQVGFSIGVLRGGGLLGGLAAWTGFTLPSALLMLAFAYGASALRGPVAGGVTHGLKLVAVAVVAQAVWGMARSLAPDRPRAGIAVAALFLVVFVAGTFGQLGAIALGAVAGLIVCRTAAQSVAGHLTFPVSRRAGAVALIAFVLLLVVPHLLAAGLQVQALALFDAFFRSGALVFGGGHVVLPLLQAAVVSPGWISPGQFLAGYGAAQAVPGPLFTFAAYLGAVVSPSPHGVVGAAIALVAIFLPGMLLVYGALPYWGAFRTQPMAQAAMRGTNAAVVGILGSALYNPVWSSAIDNPRDFAVAVLGFVLLTVGRVPPWVVVVVTALAGVALSVV